MAFPAVLAALGRGAGASVMKPTGFSAMGRMPGSIMKPTNQFGGYGGGMNFSPKPEPKEKKEKPSDTGVHFGGLVSGFLGANSKFTKAFQDLTKNITAPIDNINALAQSISKFTSLSTPGKTALLDLRIKVAYAVVGR